MNNLGDLSLGVVIGWLLATWWPRAWSRKSVFRWLIAGSIAGLSLLALMVRWDQASAVPFALAGLVMGGLGYALFLAGVREMSDW